MNLIHQANNNFKIIKINNKIKTKLLKKISKYQKNNNN